MSPEDAEDLRQGLRESALPIYLNYVENLKRRLAEEYEPPMTPSDALRAAASYFAAVNVRMRPSDVEYVVDFLNTYAEQLEGE